MDSAQDIDAPALGQLLAIRRDLHAHPELQYQEQRTAERIAAYLAALELPVHRGLGQTGLVASIHGRHRTAADPGQAIGIRTDMDALPIQERNDFAHKSTHSGRMHACGHDGHVTMLLGAATLLSRHRDFDGTVHLIFQPGEEGGAGARAMMNDGLFERFPCEAVFALHNWPALPVGQMGVRVGAIMASANRFAVHVKGRGGHAAQPHTALDPIPIACAIVGQLQSLVSRDVDPIDSAVLTVGKIESGTAENIIPDTASIYGTCRTLLPETLEKMVAGIERISTHVAAAHGATADVIIRPGYPSTRNHPKEARFMAAVMLEVVGEANAHTNVAPAMTSEDFGFMLDSIPGAYGFIGNGPNGQAGVNLHSPAYDFNDDNIAIGARFWDRLTRRWFSSST
jgi:hippurate hydrolase